jgi:hypothetical protein
VARCGALGPAARAPRRAAPEAAWTGTEKRRFSRACRQAPTTGSGP